MLPVIAIVGRPNVGKSTLFNGLTRSRDALVADQPGVTRDRKYGLVKLGERPSIIIDTGGLSTTREEIAQLTVGQAQAAVEEAHLLLFMVDARAGLNAEDQRIADDLRRRNKPVIVVINKVDGLDPQQAGLDFFALGFEHQCAISASHRRGLKMLMDDIARILPGEEEFESAPELHAGIRIAVVGRPNVGKSTLVNRLTGSDRVVAHDLPGTTRDSVAVPFERDAQHYVLIDTAGVRRRARVREAIEKISIVKTLQAITASQVVILVLDAEGGLSEQDLHLLGLILDSGRALVIAANKWDGLSQNVRQTMRREIERRLQFAEFAPMVFISARHGSGLGELMAAVRRVYTACTRRLATNRLTRVLEAAVLKNPPPLVRGRRIKLRYAHQGGMNPPRIIIHGNQTDALPVHYQRYLMRVFRDTFELEGTPVAIELRSSENPFKGRRNRLTPHQERKRKRLMKRVKAKS